MQLPFSIEQFHDVFRAYNEAVWPSQAVLLGMAVAAAGLLVLPGRWSGRAISGILALFWAWMAAAYHLAFFASINPLAYVFAGLFLVGAAIFAWQGVVRNRLDFRLAGGAASWTGAVLIVFALILYPLWSWSAGLRYPVMPTFGLPCPTTIFTIGMLCFLTRPYPRLPFIVPLLWSLIGGQAALLLDVPQDYALLAAAGVAAVMLARSRLRSDSRPASRSRP